MLAVWFRSRRWAFHLEIPKYFRSTNYIPTKPFPFTDKSPLHRQLSPTFRRKFLPLQLWTERWWCLTCYEGLQEPRQIIFSGCRSIGILLHSKALDWQRSQHVRIGTPKAGISTDLLTSFVPFKHDDRGNLNVPVRRCRSRRYVTP